MHLSAFSSLSLTIVTKEMSLLNLFTGRELQIVVGEIAFTSIQCRKEASILFICNYEHEIVERCNSRGIFNKPSSPV